ncbi:MAG TPA: hypothetical protein VF723_09775 [Pyrinomonadaceae bacterium]|jgi:hypothetical protein
MDKAKYILLLLFIGFNVLVAVSLLVKVCAEQYRLRWPAPKPGKDQRAASKRRRVWTDAIWRGQRVIHSR